MWQLRPSVVTQVPQVYLFKREGEEMQTEAAVPSAPSAAGTSEDLGWLVLSPQEESQPFALQGPYPLEGLLECRGCSLPLGSWPRGMLIPDLSWGLWGFHHTRPSPTVN